MGQSQFKAGDFFLHPWLGKARVSAALHASSGEVHLPTLTVKAGEPWQSQPEVCCSPNSVELHPKLAKTCFSAPSHPSLTLAPGPCHGPNPHHCGSNVLAHQWPALGITAGSPRAGTVPGGCSPAEVKEGPGGGGDALGWPAEEVELRQGAGLLRLHIFQVEAAHQEILTPDVL